MPTNCEFIFVRAAPIYYSGEQISGVVRLSTTKRLVLQAIKLTLVGSGQVQWCERVKAPQLVEHNDCGKVENSVWYSGQEEYYKDCRRLAESVTLEAGSTFVEQFQFTVPAPNLVTCKLSHGEVSYRLQLTLQRESTFNKHFQHRIVIKQRLNLNEQPALQEPVVVASKHASCGGVEFSVPCTGFVPGQLITYQLKCHSLLHARKLYINLCQNCAYQSLTPTPRSKEVTHILTSQQTQNVELLRDGYLKIPLGVPTSTISKKQNLIRIWYHLEAVVLNEKRAVLEKLLIPITVGTVALKTTKTTTACIEHNGSFCYDNLANTEQELGTVQALLRETHLAAKLNANTCGSSGSIQQRETVKITDTIQLLKLQSLA